MFYWEKWVGMEMSRVETDLELLSVCSLFPGSFFFKVMLEHLFLFIWVFCFHVCMCTVCVMPGTCGQMKISYPLELELWMSVSYHVDAGNQTWVLCKMWVGACVRESDDNLPFFSFHSVDPEYWTQVFRFGSVFTCWAISAHPPFWELPVFQTALNL